jgi:activator of HSP90 ATPase
LWTALISAAVDGARAIANPSDGFVFASIGSYLADYAPGAYEGLKNFFLEHASVSVWTGIAAPLLDLPLTLVTATLGVICLRVGDRGRKPEIASEA